jgi:hypothetical protein
MSTSIIQKLSVLFAATALLAGTAAPALAQNNDAAGGDGTTAAGAVASAAKPTKAERKAARKAARKEARAKKNAELKKLEDAGYSPSSRNDPNYPQDLQNAQKKAGIGQGGSQ